MEHEKTLNLLNEASNFKAFETLLTIIRAINLQNFLKNLIS